jgi:hypothetical protein
MKLSDDYTIIQIPDFSHISDEAKKLWAKLIEALRSGEYKQDKGGLRTLSGFCRPGVVCDLVKNEERTWKDRGFKTPQGYSAYILPCDIQAKYEFDSKGCFELMLEHKSGLSLPQDLLYLDDVVGATFYDIADILEKALNGGYRAVSKR